LIADYMKKKRVVALLFCLCAATACFSQEFGHQNAIDTLFIRPTVFSFSPKQVYTEKSEQAIPQNFYTQHFGFFCKHELNMQRHVPVAFRLGSMDYCNYMEGK
jgi:hypothetical protein